ncbi:MAG: hypothetical protein F6J97_11195 [Leptolyngbya sp. SIO4C1]|nr:hypothetical protein [Leptolyngbya sp. SIO4C1]
MAVSDLKQSKMMAHLLDALADGQDIGHYGRLTFVMVARHFLSENELIEQLQQDRDFSADEAKRLYQQVSEKGYSPPQRDRILEWQQQQDFAICPDADDPDACNVYQDLQFPSDVYESISEYYEEKAS